MSGPSKFTVITMIVLSVVALGFIYLIRINQLLLRTPEQFLKLAGPRWTVDQLQKTYLDLENHPLDYRDKIPPRLNRRYIVTGGNGLVGGFIVLQLLARGTPPSHIRIVDIRKPERNDLNKGSVTQVEFIPTDIRSAAAVNAAFQRAWHASVSQLPLTVFHTAAVILASDRSEYFYDFPEAVNVNGTRNILNAAKAAGADVFSSTSSASISVLPVNPWVAFWAEQPTNFWQMLDVRDFARPLRPYKEFIGTYPASKARAERLVCDANREDFRTGCIRPAHGVYGNPTDNPVGGPLSKPIFVTWIPHIVQSFVHAANVAIAHLQHEAVLLSKDSVSDIPQSGRPFIVTDPNPPITYGDLYLAVATLSICPFRAIVVPPVLLLMLSHIIEWYNILSHRAPFLRGLLPEIRGEVRTLQPGLFSICTHLIAADEETRSSIAEGGLGYQGVISTMQGMALEILEWNRENAEVGDRQSLDTAGSGHAKTRRLYTSSVTAADQLRQAIKGSGNAGS